MEVKVKVLSGGILEKSVEIPDGTTYEELIDIFSLDPEAVIVLNNGNPVPLDQAVSPDRIEIIRVVTGG